MQISALLTLLARRGLRERKVVCIGFLQSMLTNFTFSVHTYVLRNFRIKEAFKLWMKRMCSIWEYYIKIELILP